MKCLRGRGFFAKVARMLIYLLSPAKTLDFESDVPNLPKFSQSMPRFLNDSESLVKVMKEMSAQDLESMMGVSTKLAELNVERFQNWKSDYSSPEARQAILAFKGGVYQGLAVDEWSDEDFEEAQTSLRILSGLYGVLRPLDLMLAYRLEMGKKVTTDRGGNLYKFWGSLLTESLNEELGGRGDAVINLASNEYFKAVKTKELNAPVITPAFKDWKNDKLKVISFYAKKARGQMAAWAIQNRIHTPEELREFSGGGYCFDASLSDEVTYTFTRK